MRTNGRPAAAVERLEGRRLLAGQNFSGEGPLVTTPGATAVADFNGDGKKDIAVISTSANTVVIEYGDGEGAYRVGQTLTAGATPRDVAVGDFNADGRPDLLVANGGSNTIFVFLNGSSNAFTTTATLSYNFASAAPSDIVVGDFTRDGKLDFAAIGVTSSTILLGAGTGTGVFNVNTSNATASPSMAIDTADVNGDSFADLITLTAPGSANGVVNTLINTGNGTFSATQTPFAGYPVSLTAATLNADNRADLVIGFSTGTSVSVLIGNGFGAYAAAPSLAVGSGPHEVLAYPVNGDSIVDLVVANENSSSLSVFTGTGTGAFTLQQTVPTAQPPVGLTAASLNTLTDSSNDLIVTPLGGNGLPVLLAGAIGPYTGTTVLNNGATATAIATGDFNADGIVDQVAANGFSNTISVRYGVGDGTFSTNVNYTANGVQDVAVGDFNNDGYDDIAATLYSGSGSNTVTVFNGGTGVLTSAAVPVGAGPYAVTTGDFNNDGYADFATANDTANAISVRLGTPVTGVFNAITVGLPTNSNPYDILTSDFNGDGKADLAVSAYDLSGVSIFTGAGTGSFSLVSTVPVGANITALAAGDFNNDNITDLVAVSGMSGNPVLIGSGFATFSLAPPITLPSYTARVVAADFDGDNNTDLAFTNQAPGGVIVVRGLGTGAFGPPDTAVRTGATPVAIAMSDFNGDGHADLLVADTTANAINVLLNRQPYRNQLQGFANAGELAFPNSTVPKVITEANGVITITVPSLGITTKVIADAITSVGTGAPLTINSDLGQRGGSRRVGLYATNAVTLNTSQRLRYVTALSTGSVTLAAGGDKFIRTSSLGISGSRLDLNDNSLILDYSPATPPATAANSVRNLIAGARAGGAWTGNGLTSTTAKNRADGATTLGYLQATDYQYLNGTAATFAGQRLGSTSILVRYTLYGDTDLDRGVSVNDFNRLSTNFGTSSGKFWFDGDADYDGGVSINDFNLLSANFGKTLPAATPLPAVVRKGIAPAKR